VIGLRRGFIISYGVMSVLQSGVKGNNRRGALGYRHKNGRRSLWKPIQKGRIYQLWFGLAFGGRKGIYGVRIYI
jgi:hypothetical protein